MPELDDGALRASVIVVSRHRRDSLERCLRTLEWQDHPFELILVADPGALDLRPDLPIKRVGFDEANISAARNAGLAQAAGQVVLFIDDDALAEPGWVGALLAPFADPRVIAAAGFTRGPDGLNWQVRAERIDASGRSRPLPPRAALLGPGGQGDPVSTLGTNCAFRRAALLAIGGFDPAFSYHLDESDVNRRLAAAHPQGLTAVVPGAEVIHGLAAGTSRAAPGVPHDLTAIGRSTAIFAARHGGSAAWLREAQRRRLLRLMVAGRLDPLAVGPVLRTLDRGLAQAPAQVPCPPLWPEGAPPPWQELPRRPAHLLFLAGWHWQAGPLRARAARAVAEGRLVTLLLLTPGILRHRLHLVAGGWWEQRGGLWGPSRPGDPALLPGSLRARIDRERGIFAALRR
ncbi:glycosyltransferase [Paracoccus limosus]|uniref:Glycosyltransferase n=1 Tax=Paracoccus limosus TaxID=913252 RepID=A0A844H122_9RHOB|nr:glycosyltransferase [Paracoccus limosus]MTH34542.1 glycosyltransferase [Paracoccus limosus]